MNELSIEDLLEYKNDIGPCVSIYLPISEHNGDDKNRIRLKNLLKDAAKLILRDYDEPTQREILSDIDMLTSECGFYFAAKQGFSLFLSKNLRGYVLFPYNHEEFVVVSNSFHVKPLLRWSKNPRNFHLVTLSQKQVQVYSGNERTFERIWSGELFDTNEEASTQRTETGYRGTRSTSSHDSFEKKMTRVRAKYREYSGTLLSLFNRESSPLIIAGRPEYRSLFQDELGYPFALAETLDSPMESMDMNDIHRTCLDVMEEYVKQLQKDTVRLFKDMPTVRSIERIAKASTEGRVDKLLVSENSRIWGTLDRSSGKVRVFEEQRNSVDDDLLDDISEEVIRYRGSVYVLPQEQMPGQRSAYAIMRW